MSWYGFGSHCAQGFTPGGYRPAVEAGWRAGGRLRGRRGAAARARGSALARPRSPHIHDRTTLATHRCRITALKIPASAIAYLETVARRVLNQ